MRCAVSEVLHDLASSYAMVLGEPGSRQNYLFTFDDLVAFVREIDPMAELLIRLRERFQSK